MAERTFSPKIHTFPPSETVLIDLGEDNYLRMSAEIARRFGGRLLQAANEAEGKPKAHMFVIEADS